MNLTSHQSGPISIIKTTATRIDASVALQFKDQMRELTKEGERFVLDLTPVAFIDSSGLGAVVGALKQMGPGQSLELAGLSETVQKVFDLTRMSSVFTIHKTSDIAAHSNYG
jgi:anti-sigma B factor antagonist